MVNVGIYFDLRSEPEGSARAASFALEVCEEADRRSGIHSLWFTEHHLFDDGYLTQPMVFAAAAAARTARVRLGSAVILAPFKDAVTLAEEAVLVDLISGGRVDLGVGSGYRPAEFTLFGKDFERRYRDTDDLARRPVQMGVPVWLGYGGPQGAARAGRMGFPLLTADPALARPYLAGLAEGGHDPAVGRMAGFLNTFISEHPDRDWPPVAIEAQYQSESYRRHALVGTDRAFAPVAETVRHRSGEFGVALTNFFVGTPEQGASALRRYTAGTPIETVFVYARIGRMSESAALEHLDALDRMGRLLAEGSC
jgi:alkanesulfonate monooxygenase SsuD/methylene tetrahydromethanopterin reductase-like flavin-dependent oxidoreductase (luciferase family)